MENYIIDITANPLIKVMMTAVMLDTSLGLLRAIKEHRFNSTAGINGGIRKAAMLISTFCLSLIPENYIKYIGVKKLGLCEFFALMFILYESSSILKNMLLCGLPIPNRAKKFLKQFLTAMTDELPKKSKED
jgi:toxin secretion/phage lysis holin